MVVAAAVAPNRWAPVGAAVEAAERILQGAQRGAAWKLALHYVTAYDRSIF